MATVLVVDDSSIMRRNLSAILSKAGHTIVSEAANGEQAAIEYDKKKPDLVTMDITMPVLDGIGAVKKIIQKDPNANIIMISALDQKFMVLTAIQNGAKHYIIKPFSPEKVTAVVDAVLRSVEGKKGSKPEKPVSKPKSAPNVFTSTINDINQSIDNISSALQELNDTPDIE